VPTIDKILKPPTVDKERRAMLYHRQEMRNVSAHYRTKSIGMLYLPQITEKSETYDHAR